MDRGSIVFVHPVCDQDVMAGNSTIGLEIGSWLQEQDEGGEIDLVEVA